MKNSKKNAVNVPAEISDAQRQCLSHILRNCEQAIDGLLTMVEDRYSRFSPDDVSDNLQNACMQLVRILEAAKRGSFCAVPENECKFVSYFVGCKGEPDKGSKRKVVALKIVNPDF